MSGGIIDGQTTRYVNLNNPTPVAPFTDWATAATNIQDAIDAARPGDDILVTNGVYATGGRAEAAVGITSNRVSITKAVTVHSVNGPEVTIIQGASGVRCAYLTNDAMLTGITLTNAVLSQNGGGAGVLCHSPSAAVSNCVITGNSTDGSGGGAWGGTLRGCVLAGNAAGDDGGGASFSTLAHCTLTGNFAGDGGGGAYGCALDNCLVAGNHAWDDGGGGVFSCTLNHCTLTENSAEDSGGGGASNSTLNDCVLDRNSAGGGGGAAFCTLNRCRVIANTANYGGGVFSCTLTDCLVGTNVGRFDGGGAGGGSLINCRVEGNIANGEGGGATGAALTNCVLANNTVGDEGGGAAYCTLDNCVLSGNSASDGGGAFLSLLNYCALANNSAGSSGGGALDCTLNNCLITANTAQEGGGMFGGELNNGTVTGNSAWSVVFGGGGVYAGTVSNSIVYSNTAPIEANYSTTDLGFGITRLSYTCTFPMPGSGHGNITNEPDFVNCAAGNYRLRPGSPCIDVGADLSEIISHDLDGNPRPLDGNRDGLAAFDMGAYEFNPLFFTSITRVGNNMRLCWFDTLDGMQLQATPSLANPVWINVPFDPGTNCLELPAAGHAFFRLVKP